MVDPRTNDPVDKPGRRLFLGGAALLAGAASVGGTWAADAKGQKKAVPALPIVAQPPQHSATEGFVDVPGGGRIWYWDTGGHGEPVILLHPATGSGASWVYQQPAFAAAGYRVIGYSRGGFYRSDPAAPGAGSREIDALIDTLKLGWAHLVGSAAGAMTALDYALERTGRVRGLALTSSGMATDHPLIAEAWKTLLPAGFSGMPPEFRELGPSYRAANPQGTAAWLEIQKNARPPRPQGDGAAAGGGQRPSEAPARPRTRPQPAFEALAATGLPVLLLTGDCDLYMPPALLERVAALLPKARKAIIENAGHAAFWEQPAAFNAAVLAFLRDHRG